MGTSCALALARRGAQVVVLEKSVPGAEASSAAAGILGAGLESTKPGPLYDLCRASMKLYPNWVQELQKDTGVDVGFREGGSLSVAFESRTLTTAHRQFAWQGPHVQRLTAPLLRRLEPALSPTLPGGVLLGLDGRVTPPLLYRATHIAAARAGVQFRSGALVRQLLIQGEQASGVLLDDGTTLAADTVVVAAGSWTNLVDGVSLGAQRIVPARGQIVELESPEPLLSRVVCGPRCYLIPRDDGRTLIGSTLEFVGYRKAVTAQGMRDLLDAALQLVPALGSATVSGSWSNFRPFTEDHLPLLGRGHVPRLIIASGHHRNGILLAPVTAEIVTRCVLGGRQPLDVSPFDPLRPRSGDTAGP
jgi:glycine oxidase